MPVVCLMLRFGRKPQLVHVTSPVSPGRYFLWKLGTVALTRGAWQDPFTWPLLLLLLSCCAYPLASSCAHTFSSMSTRARHICFFFDYGALSFYSLGTWRGPSPAAPCSQASLLTRVVLQGRRSRTRPTFSRTSGWTASSTAATSPSRCSTPWSAPASPATPGTATTEPAGVCTANRSQWVNNIHFPGQGHFTSVREVDQVHSCLVQFVVGTRFM